MRQFIFLAFGVSTDYSLHFPSTFSKCSSKVRKIIRNLINRLKSFRNFDKWLVWINVIVCFSLFVNRFALLFCLINSQLILY